MFGLSLVAVFAFSAIAASAAFAEEALWLVNGVEPAAGVHEPIEIDGLLTLTDVKAPGGASSVHCEGTFDGWVGHAGEDEIEAVLTVSKELLEGAKEDGTGAVQDLLECPPVSGACETSMEADVETIGLPWMTLLELVGTQFVDDITSLSSLGLVGYMVTCLTILGEILDECTVALATAIIDTGAETLTGLFEELEAGNCSLGGEKSGSVEGEGLFLNTLLTVNSG